MATRLSTGIFALALVIAGCSGAADTTSTTGPTTTSPPASTTTTTTAAPIVPPELEGFDLDMVVVGDRLLLLAIADSPALRAQGLMGVTDLGDVEGMLFYWRHEADGGFWMKDTLIPLDIVWFDESGAFVGRASMEPCTEEPCPIYDPGDGIDYRYAIEAAPGALDWVDASTVIDYAD